MHRWSKRGGEDRVSTAVDDETGLKRAEVTSYLPQTTAYTPQAAVQRPPTTLKGPLHGAQTKTCGT